MTIFVQQAVAQTPWDRNVVVLDRVKGNSAKLWCAQQVSMIELGAGGDG